MATDDLRAAASTDPKDLAGVIAARLRESNVTYVEGIGAGAVNQIVKAIAISRGYLASNGSNVVCWPGFSNIGDNCTGIRFTITLA